MLSIGVLGMQLKSIDIKTLAASVKITLFHVVTTVVSLPA